jgi:hypothetical protein
VGGIDYASLADAAPDDATLTVVGVPDLEGSGDLPVSRRDLLSALFQDLRLHDGTVVIRAARHPS